MISHARRAWKRKVEPSAAFSRHLSQANEGCNFDFLEAGAETPDPEIHRAGGNGSPPPDEGNRGYRMPVMQVDSGSRFAYSIER